MSPRDKRWFWVWALTCVGVSYLPYLYAWLLVVGTDRWFLGILHYPDDAYVYLAWMRQAAEGRFLFENRFDLEPQRGLFVNLLFWALGTASRATGLSLLAVFHLARGVFSLTFLWLAYRLIWEMLDRDTFRAAEWQGLARRAAFLMVCFSAGLGWLFVRRVPNSPVDTWQTEANSFLSLYQSPLFASALSVMLAVWLFLLRAEREDSWRPGVAAGLLGLLLANIHSYDVLILWAVWPVALALFPSTRLHPLRSLGRLLLFLLLPLPAVAYQAWLLSVEPSFRLRALVPTPPAAFHWYLLGLGFLVPLAALGAWRLLHPLRNGAEGRGTGGPDSPLGSLDPSASRPSDASAPSSTVRLLGVWAVVQLALPYLPISFSRKLAMGVHVPFALLSGVGLAWIATRRFGAPGCPEADPERSARRAGAIVGLGVLVTSLTLFTWFARAGQDLRDNWSESLTRVFFEDSERQALAWLSGRPQGNVLALPPQLGGLSTYVPALAGKRVFAGHWGETPGHRYQVARALRFYAPPSRLSLRESLREREALLERERIRYVLYGPGARALPGALDPGALPSLRPAFSAGEGDAATTVYERRAAR